MTAAERQRIYVDGLKAKIHLLEHSVSTQRAELERRAASIATLEEQQRSLILMTHSMDAEIASLRAALKPFVEHKRNNVLAYDSEPIGLTMGDLRAALKALGEET